MESSFRRICIWLVCKRQRHQYQHRQKWGTSWPRCLRCCWFLVFSLNSLPATHSSRSYAPWGDPWWCGRLSWYQPWTVHLASHTLVLPWPQPAGSIPHLVRRALRYMPCISWMQGFHLLGRKTCLVDVCLRWHHYPPLKSGQLRRLFWWKLLVDLDCPNTSSQHRWWFLLCFRDPYSLIISIIRASQKRKGRAAALLNTFTFLCMILAWQGRVRIDSDFMIFIISKL